MTTCIWSDTLVLGGGDIHKSRKTGAYAGVAKMLFLKPFWSHQPDYMDCRQTGPVGSML